MASNVFFSDDESEESLLDLAAEKRCSHICRKRSPYAPVVRFASELRPEDVTDLFSVRFKKIEKEISYKQFQHDTLENVLQSALDFAYGKDLKADFVINDMLSSEKFAFVRQFLDNPLTGLNLKDCTKQQLEEIAGMNCGVSIHDKDTDCVTYTKSLCEIMRIMDCYATQTVKKKKVSLPSMHSVVNDAIGSLAHCFGLHRGSYRDSGQCLFKLKAVYQSAPEKGHIVVKSKPDLVYGPRTGSQLCIPAEVYEADKKDVHRSSQGTSEDTSDEMEMTDLHNKGTNDLSAFNKLSVKEAVPNLQDISDKLVPKTNRFQETICGQHVASLIAVAKESDMVKHQDKYEIIGMFVLNEYIFLSKLQIGGSFLDILSALPDEIQMERYEKSRPVVKYFPTAFDMTIANHRSALVLLLSYHFHLNCPLL